MALPLIITLSFRSSLYTSDVGKMIGCPVFHVNGDNPEVSTAYIISLHFFFSFISVFFFLFLVKVEFVLIFLFYDSV